MIHNIPHNKQLILFDGKCNLCNKSVIYIIKRDKKNMFLFAPLQNKIGKQIISNLKVDTHKIDSIMLYKPKKNKVYFKSTAAILIVKHLGFPTHLLVIFYLTPTFIRNRIYSFIAKNRYKWYGKKETCMIPTPKLSSKFLINIPFLLLCIS